MFLSFHLGHDSLTGNNNKNDIQIMTVRSLRSSDPTYCTLDGEVGEVGSGTAQQEENSGRGETASPENVPVH